MRKKQDLSFGVSSKQQLEVERLRQLNEQLYSNPNCSPEDLMQQLFDQAEPYEPLDVRHQVAYDIDVVKVYRKRKQDPITPKVPEEKLSPYSWPEAPYVLGRAREDFAVQKKPPKRILFQKKQQPQKQKEQSFKQMQQAAARNAVDRFRREEAARRQTPVVYSDM